MKHERSVKGLARSADGRATAEVTIESFVIRLALPAIVLIQN
jgi:hypothetical protein